MADSTASDPNQGAAIAIEIEIVPYRPDLAGAFAALNIEWLERYFVVEPIDRKILADPEGEILAQGGAILFALLDERPVGTVALKKHGEGKVELTKMAVTPAQQGAGIGRRLLRAAVAEAKRLGAATFFLESHSSLTAALYLYESEGFCHVARDTPSDYARSDVSMVFRPEEKKS